MTTCSDHAFAFWDETGRRVDLRLRAKWRVVSCHPSVTLGAESATLENFGETDPYLLNPLALALLHLQDPSGKTTDVADLRRCDAEPQDLLEAAAVNVARASRALEKWARRCPEHVQFSVGGPDAFADLTGAPQAVRVALGVAAAELERLQAQGKALLRHVEGLNGDWSKPDSSGSREDFAERLASEGRLKLRNKPAAHPWLNESIRRFKEISTTTGRRRPLSPRQIALILAAVGVFQVGHAANRPRKCDVATVKAVRPRE